MSVNIPEIFACNVFNEEVMKARLPKNIYINLKRPAAQALHLI